MNDTVHSMGLLDEMIATRVAPDPDVPSAENNSQTREAKECGGDAQLWADQFVVRLAVTSALQALRDASLDQETHTEFNERIHAAARDLELLGRGGLSKLMQITHELTLRAKSEDAFLAYLAGLIDGDGCISITQERRHRPTPTTQVRIWITGDGEHMMAIKREVSRRFGITSCVNQTRSPKLHQVRRSVYTFQAAGKQALHLARLLRNRIVLKRLQILAVLHLANMGQLGTPFGIRGLPESIRLIRYRMYLVGHLLNSGTT